MRSPNPGDDELPTKDDPASDAADSGAPSKRRRRSATRTAEAQSSEGPNPDAHGAARAPLFYVGIGASAGGLEALRPFVAALPTRANMTYLIAQHMSPAHRSLMVELLGRETGLKVEEASNNRAPRADTIYVAPPNTDLTVSKGKLRISKPTNTVGPKPSVDRFLISLADDQEDRAIGIILSGTGSDGARGIKAIKAAGGISIAQDPKSAKYDSMPTAAIRSGGADLVLPPHEIAHQLRAIVQRPRPPIEVEADEAPPSTSIGGLIRQINVHTGMDFSNYKDSTISRQILRRMAAMQIPSIEAYGTYVAKNRNELAELAGNFLICVTSFFRDPDAFDSTRRLLREVLKKKRPGDEIRIWVPGCATGEEVYSLAIVLAELMGDQRDRYKVQIFATDINGEAVSSARAGTYPEAALSGMDSTLVARYFSASEGLYQIDQSLREMCLFARQDLVQDPPFVRLDMISCRNLLIYFKGELQERVLKIFHYALREDGLLFLGKSESVGRLGSLFTEADRRHKIYLRRSVATPIVGGFQRQREPGQEPRPLPVAMDSKSVAAQGQDRLFELYAPASLLMTANGDILEIFGECGEFLSIRKGRADFNAFTLIKEPFRAELRAFAHRVSRSRGSARCSTVELGRDGKASRWRMAVHAAGTGGMDGGVLLLVCFEPADDTVRSGAMELDEGVARNVRIAELEQEIALNRENLQTVIEELETANEELQALNEEAQASNEELQASNEELETANEELQASNEELITVNDELGTRSFELGETNSDLRNVLESLEQGLLVVDAKLAVTRYNRIALEFFDIPPDSRPNLSSLRCSYKIPELIELVRKVSSGGKTREVEFAGDDGRSFAMRLTPYVANGGDGAAGAVIMLRDITEKKRIEDQLRLAASVFEHGSDAAMITDSANHIIAINPAFTRITGYAADDVIGQNPHVLSSGEHPPEFYEAIWSTLLTSGQWHGEVHNRRKNGELYIEYLSINVQRDAKGKIERHIGVFRDITEYKRAQETIRRQATYDSLTGLPNRALTLDRIRQTLATRRRSKAIFAVMFLDLDHFKAINDALGHDVGDELLIEAAKRITGALRESDSVGRMGGDEFIVILGELSHAEDVMPIADKILALLQKPMVIKGHSVRTSASIGITVYPMDGDSPETILKNADSAMYEAKKLGRNTACFFTHRMQDEANKRHWIDTELEAAVARGHLEVHYQPIIRLDTMSLAGAEALLRWNHPSKGLIPPEVFIPVAEQNGMIGRLSHWTIAVSLADWGGAGPDFTLSFNLSAAQFLARDHIEQILAQIEEGAGTRRHGVTVEVTEGLRLTESGEHIQIFNRLRAIGCNLALDDFGTGFASLSYLKRLPFGVIKIDRSFVSDITLDSTDAAMVKAILQIAGAFGMTTVAEGVETQAQLEFLREHGCTYAQGFLFGAPMPHKRFIEFSAAHQRQPGPAS